MGDYNRLELRLWVTLNTKSRPFVKRLEKVKVWICLQDHVMLQWVFVRLASLIHYSQIGIQDFHGGCAWEAVQMDSHLSLRSRLSVGKSWRRILGSNSEAFIIVCIWKDFLDVRPICPLHSLGTHKFLNYHLYHDWDRRIFLQVLLLSSTESLFKEEEC